MQNQIDDWRIEAEALIKWGCDLVGMSDVAPNITLIFNNRMRTTMGRAWTNYGPNTCYSKPEYAQILNPQQARGGLICFCVELYQRVGAEARKENILHELAHILANLKANEGISHGQEKNVGHSYAWKQMMRRLGQKPSRCHKHDTSGLKRKHAKQDRYQISCPAACGWEYTFVQARRTRRINEARRGATRYCPKCRAAIRLEHWQATRRI